MQPNLLSGLLNNASTSMKVVQKNAKKKEDLAKKELGTLSNVVKTTTKVAQANTPQVVGGFGDKNNPQSLLDLHKTTTWFQPLEFDNLMGTKQSWIPNLWFTNLGTKAVAPEKFKTELDKTEEGRKDNIRSVLKVVENGGTITKQDIDVLLKPLQTDEEKRKVLDLVWNSWAKIEGIHYNTEQENLMNIGNTGISVNPIKQAGDKILELKDYLKNNDVLDPKLKNILKWLSVVSPMLWLATNDIVTQWALWFAGNTVRGVGQVIEWWAGLVDKGIAGVQSVVEWWPMSQYQTRQTGVGEDILDIGAGATQTLASIYAMPASLLIGTGIETLPEEWQKAVAETMTWLWWIIAQTPWLKQWMESLPKNRQDEFKTELAGATVWLLMWLKNKGNIIKDPKLFIKENLNPVQIAKNFNENVIGIPSKALDMAVNTVGKVKIPDVNIKTPEVITSLQKTFNPDIDTLIDKSIKPTVVWKTQNVWELDKYRTNTKKSMDSIIENKWDIQYRNEDWVYKQWELPSTINEFAQAIEQTKKKIYERYNAETKTAWWQWAKVDVNPIVLELQKLDQELAGQIGTKATRTYIQKQIKEIWEIWEMTPEMAQKNKQFLNNKLQAYYRSPNPNEVGNVLVDALINNNLWKILDDTIINALDNSQYRDLKNQYGSLSAIEKDVVKRALVTARKNTKWLVDFTDIMFAWDIAQSLLTGNPVSAVKWLAWFWLKELYKWLNDVDKNVKSLFSKYSKNVSSTMNDSSNGMIPNLSTTKRLALPENRSVDYLYEWKKPVDLWSNIDKFGNKITPKQWLSNLSNKSEQPLQLNNLKDGNQQWIRTVDTKNSWNNIESTPLTREGQTKSIWDYKKEFDEPELKKIYSEVERLNNQSEMYADVEKYFDDPNFEDYISTVTDPIYIKTPMSYDWYIKSVKNIQNDIMKEIRQSDPSLKIIDEWEKRFHQLEAMEQRIWKIWNNKVSKAESYKQSIELDAKRNQLREQLLDEWLNPEDLFASRSKNKSTYEPKKSVYVSKKQRFENMKNRVNKHKYNWLSNLKSQWDMPKLPPKIPKELPAKQKIADTPLSNLQNPKKSVQSDTLVSKSDEMGNKRYIDKIESTEKTKLPISESEMKRNNLTPIKNLKWENTWRYENKSLNQWAGNRTIYSKEWDIVTFKKDDAYKIWYAIDNQIENNYTVPKWDIITTDLYKTKDLQPLYDEAKKYKSADEWLDNKKSLHRPPDIDNWSRLDDLTNSYWDDIYSANAIRYYGDASYLPDKKVLQIIKQAKKNPEMDVTIYRAIEKWDRETFNPWDWVSLTKEYVKEHWEWPLKWKYKIIEQKVKVKDIVWNADSLQEYWYRPNWHKDFTKDQLRKIREEANRKSPWLSNLKNK